jgi:hypothetical protein
MIFSLHTLVKRDEQSLSEASDNKPVLIQVMKDAWQRQQAEGRLAYPDRKLEGQRVPGPFYSVPYSQGQTATEPS